MKNFTRFIFLSLSLLTLFSCSKFQADTKDTTSYYLLRHAEKVVEDTDDPDLSPSGHARAQKVSTMLKDKKIERLYATSYKRTQQTLLPLSETLKLQISIYDPGDAADVDRMLADCKGKNAVIADFPTILRL